MADRDESGSKSKGETRLTITGVREFESDMGKLTAELEDADIRALREYATSLVPKVRSLMPKVSGALAQSVHVDQTQRQMFVDIIAQKPYAAWIEFGGTRGRARIAEGRFLFPTVRGSSGQMKSKLDASTRKTIGGFKWTKTA